MSERPPADLSEDDIDGADLTAAEYALGVLDGKGRAAAEVRSASDPDFARQVLAWVMRFAPLIEAVTPIDPSPALWPKIEAAISRTASPLPSTPPATAANDDGRGRLDLWRTWAVAATAVAAAAILFVAVRPVLPIGSSQPSGQVGGFGGGRTLVATLALTTGKTSALTVAYDPARATLYAAPDADFSIPLARSAELWLIPADGKPRPVGLVDVSKPATMPMPAQFKVLAQEKATLALSIEPPGGSTTGLPTGPVVAAGTFTAV